MGTPRSNSGVVLLLITLLLCSCVHRLTLHSRDGEKLNGRWRFGREGSGLIQVFAGDGEVLIGALDAVARRSFFERYQETFGRGSIAADGPDLSAYGNVYGARLGAPTLCWTWFTGKVSIPRLNSLEAWSAARCFIGLQTYKATKGPTCNAS